MNIILLLLHVVLWTYGLKLYNTSKKVEYECNVGNKTILIVLFTIAGILFLVRNFNIYGIFQAVSIILFGFFYSLIKSGFNKEGIIVQGKFYPYSIITSFTYENVYDSDSIRVNLAKGSKMFMFFINDKEKACVEEYRKLYLKR